MLTAVKPAVPFSYGQTVQKKSIRVMGRPPRGRDPVKPHPPGLFLSISCHAARLPDVATCNGAVTVRASRAGDMICVFQSVDLTPINTGKR